MNVIFNSADFSDGSGSVVPFGGHQCVCETKTDRYDWTSVGICLGGADFNGRGLVPGAREEEYLVVLLLAVCLLLLILLFKLSKVVSVLSMKNRELAMQVSLLNQENERILHRLGDFDR